MQLPQVNTTAGAFALGAVTLVGGIFAGKIAVDFAQGHTGDGSEFDDSVRLVASLVGLSLSVMQLPAAYQQAQKFIAAGKLPASTP